MTLWRAFKYIVFLLLIAGGIYAFGRYRSAEAAKSQPPFGVVKRSDLTIKVTISGGVMPKKHAMITPPYNGYVQQLFVKVGDKVQQGAPVISIAQTIGAVQEEVFPLRSPLSGVVVQVWRKVSEYVSANSTTLVRIDDISKLYIDANVPEVEISKLRLGLPVEVRAMAVPQRSYRGKITEIAQAAKEQDRWERARVEFPLTAELIDQDEQLKPGMSVVMDVIVRQVKGALQLRHEYVEKSGNDYFVTTKDGTRKRIEVGLENEEAFEVKSGVNEGEEIRQVDFLAVTANGSLP